MKTCEENKTKQKKAVCAGLCTVWWERLCRLEAEAVEPLIEVVEGNGFSNSRVQLGGEPVSETLEEEVGQLQWL